MMSLETINLKKSGIVNTIAILKKLKEGDIMSEKLCILWLFIAMIAFSLCSNDDNIMDVSKYDEICESGVSKDDTNYKIDRMIQ
jgi:hypothetical protein